MGRERSNALGLIFLVMAVSFESHHQKPIRLSLTVASAALAASSVRASSLDVLARAGDIFPTNAHRLHLETDCARVGFAKYGRNVGAPKNPGKRKGRFPEQRETAPRLVSDLGEGVRIVRATRDDSKKTVPRSTRENVRRSPNKRPL